MFWTMFIIGAVLALDNYKTAGSFAGAALMLAAIGGYSYFHLLPVACP